MERKDAGGVPPLTEPVNRIFAVIDDAAEAERAVADLEAALSPGAVSALCCEAGADRLDASGLRGGALHQAVRMVQSVLVEGRLAKQYDLEAQKGHFVFDVAVPTSGLRDKAIEVLKAHGAHFINAYGRWTVEEIQP